MIVDQLTNSQLYAQLSLRISRAFEYLHQTDFETLPAGRYEIDDMNIYAMVQQYSTKSPEAGKWEAHREYIDLQYIVEGTEQIGVAHLGRLVQGEYDSSKDFLPLSGQGDFLTLASGEFILLFPQDAHMPGLSAGMPSEVKKVVVKIAVK
jgi:YhcH/YjgK/YiaL family protein